MRYQLKAYSIWECGQRVDAEGNPHQEDSIFPAHKEQKDTDRFFILCDGMGGHAAGEVASSTVCAAMSKSIFESIPDAEGDFDDGTLMKAIADAFDALDAHSSGKESTEKKMGTTMTFLKFHNRGCTIAHMGDSRVYHIRPGKGREDTKILFKTSDHSLVNDLIKVGELTPEEAKLSKQKNIITRAMQPNMERRPKPDIYHTADIKKGDYFYMCSDGMLEQMEDENLLFNFSDATGDDDNKVKILTQATSQNSDNHSAIIVHVLDVIDPLPVETTPVINKPKPIMAEVNEEESSPTLSKQQGNIQSSIGIKPQKTFGIWVCVLLTLIVILFSAWYFFTSPKSDKDHNPKTEEMEVPTKQPFKLDRKIRQSSSSKNVPQTKLSDKTNEAVKPHESNQESQHTKPDSAVSAVPSRLQNTISSLTNQNDVGGNRQMQQDSGKMHPATVNQNHDN